MTPEAFDRLLTWLGDDRDSAARKYEEIRRGLIRIFIARGCRWAEELADETINRVVRKIFEVADNFDDNDPARYFYGVARNVHREYLHNLSRPLPAEPPPPADPPSPAEEECLASCLGRLEAPARDLVIDYFSRDKQAKIDLHKQMAARLGVTVNALRIRAFRIRGSLRECVLGCLGRGGES